MGDMEIWPICKEKVSTGYPRNFFRITTVGVVLNPMKKK